MIAVVTGDDLAAICKPWQTQLAPCPPDSPPQHPLARDEACWQGEAVIAVVAETRAKAEDALELVEIDWTELPAIATRRAPPRRLRRRAQRDGRQLGLEHAFSAGDPDGAFRDAAVVVEHDFTFGRQTGVTLEPRTIVAEFDRRLRQLTIHHSHQVPNQMREIFAAQLGLPLPMCASSRRTSAARSA